MSIRSIDPEQSRNHQIDQGLEPHKGGREVEGVRLRAKLAAKLETGVDGLRELFPNLRPNQWKALQDLKKFLNESPDLNGYFQQPTGAGKTFLFGLLVRILNEPTLVLVPNTNLLDSTKQEFLGLGMDEQSIGLVGDGNNEIGRQVTIMTYKSFLLDKYKRDYRLIVCDEAHRSLGNKTADRLFAGEELSEEEEMQENDVLEQFGRQSSNERLILGFTATPELGAKNVSERFGPLISRTSYAELIAAGILKSIRSVPVDGEIDESMESKGRLNPEEESEVLAKAKTYSKLLARYKDFKRENPEIRMKTAVFCNSVESCSEFKSLAEAEGLKAMIVTGTVGKDDLQKAEAALMSGEIDLIITVDKLKEGWNFPALNSVIWARATNSPAVFVQGVGRAAREYNEEKIAYVFEANWYVSNRAAGVPESREERSKSPTDGPSNSTRRRSRRALNLAQALYACGEDPHGILLNPSEELGYDQSVDLDEKGVGSIEIDGQQVEVIGAYSYASSLEIHPGTLLRCINAAGLSPLPSIQGRIGTQLVAIYNKKQVDSVLPSKQVGESVFLNENGVGSTEVDGQQVELIGVKSYARLLKIARQTLLKWIEKAGLSPLPSIQGRSGPNSCAVYDKIKVDAVVSRERASELIGLDENGVGSTEVDGQQVELIGVKSYARLLKMAPQTLLKWIEAAGLSPLSNIQGKRGSHPFDVYDKLAVDAAVEARKNLRLSNLEQAPE